MVSTRSSALALIVLLATSSLAGHPADEPRPPSPESEGPPPVSSPWKSLWAAAPPEKVREEMLELFREEGLKLLEEDKKEQILRTNLIPFDANKFKGNVAIPPPKFTPEYPYYVINEMISGRFGLECHIVPEGLGRTRLDLRALLDSQGIDKNREVARWIPRISNGEVERQYFERLVSRFKPQTSPVAAPSR